jgi:hypothetical protein
LSKTKYNDFEGQIAALIPAEIYNDETGKAMTVLARAQVWSKMTIAIKHVADTGVVGDVVRQVQRFKDDLEKFIAAPPVVGVAAAGAGAGGADPEVVRLAEVNRAT